MNTEIEHKTGVEVAGKPKLLVADDSVTIRKVVELTFADEGIDVAVAGSGEEAMQKFVEIEPDIVLLDVNMPDPTGYQICEMIKQDDATRHIPVLLLVGSFEPFDQDEAERVSADGFLVKPFQSIRDLVAKVNDLLGPEKEPVRPAPETTDIDNLYQNSFSETYRTDASDTQDIFLGNAGMDDEIIDLTRPIDEAAPSDMESTQEDLEQFMSPPAETDDELAGIDWFAQRVDEENNKLDVAEHGDAGQDEAPEAENSNGADWHAEPDRDNQPEPQIVPSRRGPVFFPDEDAPLLDLDKVDTLRDMEVQPTRTPSADVQEPSDEFVTLVARRVIEKLSDRVVREIAREAVPRIAEELIREALAEENKEK